MNEHEIYGYGYNCREDKFVVYRASQSGETAQYGPLGQGFRHITDGLRVLDCFSSLQPTLTTDEISDLLDLPESEVTRHAARLAGLGYLHADSDGESAWRLSDV